MSDKLKNILSKTECPSTDQFYYYLEGKLSKDDKRMFESHLVDCEFCSEALEGFEQTDKAFFTNSISEINKKINKRVSTKFSIQYMAAAASIMIALFFGSIYMLNDTSNSKELSLKTQTEEEINKDELAPVELEENTMLESNKNTEEIIPLEETAEKPIATNEQLSVDLYKKSKSTSTRVAKDLIEVEDEEAIEEIAIFDMIDEQGGAAEMEEDADMFIMEDTELETTTKSITTSETQPASATNNEVLAGNSNNAEGYVEISANKNDIDFENLLAFANEKINTQFVVETTESKDRKKKKESYQNNSVNEEIAYEYKNTSELLQMIDDLNGEVSQNTLDNIHFQQTKDVWTTDEQSTLKWLEIVALLKLNKDAEPQLKELKKTKTPYQQEAKKLYNKLY